MKPTFLLILFFTFNLLANSRHLNANETTQLKHAKPDLPPVPLQNMKQIYHDEYGTWFLSKYKGKKGGCAVSYSSGLNQLALLGPTEKHHGAFIFTGPYIPTTHTSQPLNIVMRTDQTEIPTKATLLSHLKKSILFVPVSMAKIAPNMEDVGMVEILLQGKTIYASSISGGFRARDALMSCIKS